MTTFEIWMVVGMLLSLAVAIGALAVTIVQVNKKQQAVITNQPLMVEMAEKFVEHGIFNDHVRQTRQAFENRDKQRSDDLKDAKDSRKLIYDKIEAAAKGMRDDLDNKHVINEKKIGRINWMLARLCERNRINVPGEDENL